MTIFLIIKDEQNFYYNGGGDAIPQKIWSHFSTIKYYLYVNGLVFHNPFQFSEILYKSYCNTKRFLP